MKLSRIHRLLLLASLCACSTVSTSVSHRKIELIDMEHLRPGRASSIELKGALGAPAQTIATSSQEDTWIYTEPHGQENWQRASFTIDKKSGSILSSVLLLNDEDLLHDLNKAIDHFNASRFIINEEGWINNHEYSGNSEYSDPVNGISLTVKKTRKTVSEIGFWQPGLREH